MKRFLALSLYFSFIFHVLSADEEPISAKRVPRIAYGEPAEVYDFPFVVLVSAHDTSSDRWIRCGGSIIAPDFVLTEAVCLSSDDIDKIEIYYASLNASIAKDTRRISVATKKDVIVHPDYEAGKDEHDHLNAVALIRLEIPLTVNDQVMTIKLSQGCPAFNQGRAKVMGWGLTEKGEASSNLLKADAVLLSRDDCRRILGLKDELRDEVLCASGANGRNVCLGDTGGPLVVKGIYGEWVQIGIVIYQTMVCGAKKPSLYIRVSGHIDWIVENASPQLADCPAE